MEEMNMEIKKLKIFKNIFLKVAKSAWFKRYTAPERRGSV